MMSGSMPPLIPALFTSASSLPKAATVAATASLQSASLVTSSRTKRASPPEAPIAPTTCCPSTSSRSATTTFAPSLANSAASLAPMPCAPPVISATFPSSLIPSLLSAGGPKPPSDRNTSGRRAAHPAMSRGSHVSEKLAHLGLLCSPPMEATAIIDAWILGPALVHRPLPDGKLPVDRDAFPRRFARPHRTTLTSSFPTVEVGHALDPLRGFSLIADAAPTPGAVPPRAPPRGMGLRVRLVGRSRLVSQSDPRVAHPSRELCPHHQPDQARDRRVPPGAAL